MAFDKEKYNRVNEEVLRTLEEEILNNGQYIGEETKIEFHMMKHLKMHIYECVLLEQILNNFDIAIYYITKYDKKKIKNKIIPHFKFIMSFDKNPVLFKIPFDGGDIQYTRKDIIRLLNKIVKNKNLLTKE